MTIGKRLYRGFGSILLILVVLLIVNWIAGLKASSARKDFSTAQESVDAIEDVRYQIMLNSLSLNNFLLSGDPRDEEKVTRGLQDVTDIMKRGESQAGSELLRTSLVQVEGSKLGRQLRQAFAGETPPSGLRGCYGFGPADLLSAERSRILVGKIVCRP